MVPELQGDINYSAITYGNCQFVIVYGIYLPTIGWALSSPFIPDVPSGPGARAEGSAFEGFSWHKPHKELLFRDSLNEVGYVDGHVDFVKIFWNGSLGATGAACFYDPPQGYAYTWSGK